MSVIQELTEDKRGSISFPQYQHPDRKYLPELQKRSHSHGEEYYHRVHPLPKLPPCSPHSSGYSSMASSMAQFPSQSQESLSGGSVKSPTFYSASHRSPTVGPFASRPQPPAAGSANVNRSSSLKAKAESTIYRAGLSN